MSKKNKIKIESLEDFIKYQQQVIHKQARIIVNLGKRNEAWQNN